MGTAPPYWLEEALAWEGDAPDAPALVGELDVDVAIVGAGYTGLWTALALKRREPASTVALLEAEVVGWGPSGRNGGFLHAFETRAAKLRELLGDDDARHVILAGQRVIPAVEAFCAERRADVWLRQSGYLKVSAAPAQDRVLEAAVGAMAALGLDDRAVPLTGDEVRARVRSPVFRRGVLFPDCATIQPARLCRALRAAVIDAGVALHERTRVTAIGAGSPNTVRTPAGVVRAAELVLCVNAWGTGWPPVAGRLTNFSSHVVLTEPVPDLAARVGLAGGEAVTDGRSFVHYFQALPDGRVLMGQGGGPIGYGGRVDAALTSDPASARRAERGLRRLLPGLAGVAVTHAWGGPIDVSADQLPLLDTVPGTRIHYALGYSGSGVGPSWIGGQVLASLVLSHDDEWSALPLVGRAVPRLPPEPIRSVGARGVRRGLLACEEAEERARRGPIWARALEALPRLTGVPIGRR